MIEVPIKSLSDKAEYEVYVLIDKHLRSLPKNSDGSIDKNAKGFQHNDVDALRHAYGSILETSFTPRFVS